MTKSWDDRKVLYENVHSINPEDMEKLIYSIHLRKDESFLDIGCGYGSVSRKIIEMYGSNYANFFLLDFSQKQLDKTLDLDAKRINQNILELDLENDSIDKAIAKMCLHEINYKEQQEAINNIYRVLKHKSIFSIWDTALKDEVEQHYFHRLIGEKDRLSGFNSFILDRFFPIIGNLISMVSRSGFTLIDYYPITYKLSTNKRLEEIGGQEKLDLWHDYIRTILNKNLIKRFKVQDLGYTIEMEINKGIYVCKK